MGFFDGLKKFNDALDSIHNTKETVKKGVDRKSRTEDEKKDIKKCNIWSLIHLVIILGLGLGLFFLAPIILDDDALLLWSIIIVGAAIIGLATSVGKQLKFMNDDVVGFGAKVFFYFNIVLIVLMFLLNLLGHFML